MQAILAFDKVKIFEQQMNAMLKSPSLMIRRCVSAVPRKGEDWYVMIFESEDRESEPYLMYLNHAIILLGHYETVVSPNKMIASGGHD